MGTPEMNQTYKQDFAALQAAGFYTSSISGEKSIEWAEVTEKWRLLDIKNYLFALKSREKAHIVAECMTGTWIQLAVQEMIKPIVYEKNGNVAWELKVIEKSCSMQKYLDNVIDMYYDAMDMLQNSEQKLNEYEGKMSEIQVQSNSEYEAIVKEELQPMQTVFAKYHLKEKIPMLNKMTTAQYDRFCLKLIKANPSWLMAYVYVIGLPNYIKRDDNNDYIFATQSEMLNMLVEATGKSKTSNLSQELKTITSTNANGRSAHTAWKYVDEAKKQIESL